MSINKQPSYAESRIHRLASPYRIRIWEIQKRIHNTWCQKWFDFIFDICKCYNIDISSANTELWGWLSAHEYTTMDFIEAHPEYPWKWSAVSDNKNLTYEYIIAHPDLSWDWQQLSLRDDLTIEFVNLLPNKPWEWHWICKHSGIFKNNSKFNLAAGNNILEVSKKDTTLIDILLSNLGEELFWSCISGNDDITLNDIRNNIDKPWDWSKLSRNPNITIDFVIENINKPWDWVVLSDNDSFTLADFDAHPELPWSWDDFKYNTCITIKDIRNNPGRDWSLSTITRKLIFEPLAATLQFVIEYKDKLLNIDWNLISEHMCLSADDLITHPELPWDQLCLSKNKWLKVADVPKLRTLYPDFTLHYENPSNTFANVLDKLAEDNLRLANLEPFEYDDEYISSVAEIFYRFIKYNRFDLEYTSFIKKEYQQHLAAFRIQQWWHRLRLDPRHPVGRRRIEREYDELIESGLL